LLLTFKLNAQNLGEKYDLNFGNFNECNWDWLVYQRNCKGFLDVNPNNHSSASFKMQYDTQFGINDMGFILSKSIILPKTVKKRLTITLTSKSSSIKDFTFKIIAIDKNEEIQFQKELEVKNANKWIESKISIPGNTKVFNIYIRYIGNRDPKQTIWLKDITVNGDGQTINRNKIDIESQNTKAVKLETEKIISLQGDSVHLLDKIKDLSDKKIIGLGENTHGSATISNARVQLLKNLVSGGHCKLILLEMPVDFALLMDLYIQDRLPSTSEEDLNGYLKLGMDYKIMKGFLKWLKIYNTSAKVKVHLFGIDNYSAGGKLPLMDYHVALLGLEKSEFYLKKIQENKLNDIIDFSKKDPEIKRLLGEKGYIYYLNTLSGKFNSTLLERFSNRDSLMLKRVEFLDSLFTNNNEKTVILAHAGHLQKIKAIGPEGQFDVLGSLLNKKYGSNYYALDFNFGSGTFNQDSCISNQKYITDTLKNLAKNSFEYAANQTGYNFFLYPAKYLDEDINTTAYIVRNGQNKDHFKFASLRNRFDGYVFLKKSESMTEIEKNPLLYSLRLFDGKRVKFSKILKTSN